MKKGLYYWDGLHWKIMYIQPDEKEFILGPNIIKVVLRAEKVTER